MAETRKRNKKKIMILFTVGILLLNWFFAPEYAGGMFPYEVSAKVSKSTKKKAAKAYREFMYDTDYWWFRTIDMDGDGLKELVVSYESNSGVRCKIYIYKYRKGQVRYVGEEYSMFGHAYNKKMKRLMGCRGGGGSIEDWYLTTSKSGKLKWVYLSQIETHYKTGRMTYDYFYAGKKISKKAFFKKKRSWKKNCVPFNMHKTSLKNLKKYI